MRRRVLTAKNWLFEPYGTCSLLVLTWMHQLETLFIVLHENQWEDTLFQGSPELFSPSVKRRALGSRLLSILDPRALLFCAWRRSRKRRLWGREWIALLFKHSASACANVLALRYLAYQKKKKNMLVFFFFCTSNWHFSWFYRHKRNVRTVRVGSCLRQRREMISCRLGRLKCSVVNMAVHEWSCLSGLSVDEFQDLLTQSGQVLKAKIFSRCVILLVGLGGPTLMKKTMKWESGVLPCHGMVQLPRILFGHERGNLRSTRLALPHRMAEARPEEMICSQTIRSRPGMCC